MEFDLPQQSHRVQPAEEFFDLFMVLLTHGVAGMAGGPSINRTGTVRRVLGRMGVTSSAQRSWTNVCLS